MGKKIAVFGAQKNLEQFVRRAVALGYELYGFASGDDNPCVKYYKEFYNISFTEIDKIISICKEKGIQGVTSFSLESALPYVIKVSQALGTTSNSLHHSELINDKYVMRQQMQKFGVNIPKYIETDAYEHLSDADLKDMEYPVIVKPIDGGGSRGVTKVTKEEDLASAIEYAKQYSRKKVVIVEQFISGREFSVEYISHKGYHYFLTITDKVTEPEHFIEIEHHQPADIPFAVAQKIREQVEKTLNALEITDSPSHTEVMLHSDGEIYVIECGPRMGGDNIQASLVRLSTGYDLVAGALELCSNNFQVPVFNNQKYAGIYFILPGTEYVADWLQNHKDDSKVVEWEYKGYISNIVQNNGERDGYFIYQSDKKITINYR